MFRNSPAVTLALTLIVAAGATDDDRDSAADSCPALERITFEEHSAAVDGVQLGDEVYRLGSTHQTSLDLSLRWGPLMDAPCGRLTGSVPEDPDGLRFSVLPNDGSMRLGEFSLRCDHPIDVGGVVDRLRAAQPSLSFFSHGPPWTEASDDSPVYVVPGGAYYVFVAEDAVSVGMERCFSGGRLKPGQ